MSCTANRRRRRRPVLAAVAGLLAVARLLSPAGAAQAAQTGRFSLRGDAGAAFVATTMRLPVPDPAASGITIRSLLLQARVEATYEDEEAGTALRLVANPRVARSLAAQPAPVPLPGACDGTCGEWALEEAYGAVERGPWAVHAGLERLPLEAARLSLPLAVEPLTAQGLRLGLWGARVSWSRGPWRARLAMLQQEGRLFPALSLRHEAGSFEIEAHALGRPVPARPTEPVAGITASGLAGDVVAYGEAWFAAPAGAQGLRQPGLSSFAAGLSGFAGDALWTLEGADASPSPGQPPRRFVAAQLAWEQPGGDGWVRSWGVTQYAFLDEGQTRAQLALSHTTALDQHEAWFSLGAGLGPREPSWSLSLGYRLYWAVP